MKRVARIVLPAVIGIMLAMPGVAMAAGNTTEIEQKWIDLQKAVTDQMVKDGSLTRQQADERMAAVKQKFADSDGDSIYDFFARKNMPENGCRDGNCGEGRERERRRIGGKEAT